jgi:Clp amino terminal domain, pathogenicity island component
MPPGDMPGGIMTPVTGPMAFTGHASKALILARQESSRLGRPRGPEHILVGLVSAGDGLAVRALERLGVRPEADTPCYRRPYELKLSGSAYRI